MDDDRYISDGGGDRYGLRDDDPYADARPMNDTGRFNRPPFDERMRQTPSPSGKTPYLCVPFDLSRYMYLSH